jgi:hypothetical protein
MSEHEDHLQTLESIHDDLHDVASHIEEDSLNEAHDVLGHVIDHLRDIHAWLQDKAKPNG